MNANHLPILPLDTIRAKAPSIFADRPADHVSPEYKFIPTHEILDHLMGNGWSPIAANQQKVRKLEKMNGTKHSLSLIRSGEDPKMLSIGGLLPTINLVNSHDWSSTFRIVFGMYRLICSNGLMVGGAEFASYTIRHDSIMSDLQTTLNRFESSVTLMLRKAQEWAEIGMAFDEAFTLAKNAALIRFGENASEDQVRALMYSRRSADDSDNLWNVYNRLQENGIQGGVRFGNARRVRKLANIQATTDYNTKLYELADTFASELSTS